MAEIIVFPDAVAGLIGYLAAELPLQGTTASVGTRVPNNRPGAFVVIRRIGGQRDNLVVDAAALSVECWGESEEDAHDLAQLVRGFIHAVAGTTQGTTTFYRIVEIGGPAFLPDPDSDQPRFVATYQVSTRGAAI